MISLFLVGCVDNTPPIDTSFAPPPEYVFYTQDLTAVKGTNDSPRDFTKILTDYAASAFDFAAAPVFSAQWSIDVTSGNSIYKNKLVAANSAGSTVISASVSSENRLYTFASADGTAYYNLNGTKCSYLGNLGGRPLVNSIFPVPVLSSDQKDLLNSVWLLVPFDGEIVFGTNSGGSINEYVGNIDVDGFLKNLAMLRRDKSDTASVMKKVNAALLKLVNAVFDKNLTEINKDVELPQIKAKTHLITEFSGNREKLKEIYINLEVEGFGKREIHVYDFSMSNKNDEYSAAASVGDTSGYTEINDEGYAELFDSVSGANLKETFKFISDYLAELRTVFN